MPPLRPPPNAVEPALVVILGGVCAALHVGKLAPAIATLQAALGLTLVEAGFLLSAVQAAGMTLGLVFGVVADGLGGRRSMALGLALLATASAGGALADGVAQLMALRVVEGFGFLLVVLPAPGLVRRLVPAGRVSAMLGVWGAYMPLATALVLLLGPLFIGTFGWRSWWAALAAVTAAMAVWLLHSVPRPAQLDGLAAAPHGARGLGRLRDTLAAPGPWLVATVFAMYSGQWLAVIGFLPAIYTQAGVAGAATGVLTAGVAAANIVGNVASGRLLQRGVAPGVLLTTGFVTMAFAALAAFAAVSGAPALPPVARYAALLLFSAVGGLIPATLFALAVRVAPGEGAMASTIGWVQQWSSLGQFAGPPLVAAVASAAGGWQLTGLATAGCSLLGLALSALLVRRLPALPRTEARAARVSGGR
ncbi:MAG: MFS transporter [Rubrivivax sp.]|nr:MFS transporter [Rubrivivax sp.]